MWCAGPLCLLQLSDVDNISNMVCGLAREGRCRRVESANLCCLLLVSGLHKSYVLVYWREANRLWNGVAGLQSTLQLLVSWGFVLVANGGGAARFSARTEGFVLCWLKEVRLVLGLASVCVTDVQCTP